MLPYKPQLYRLYANFWPLRQSYRRTNPKNKKCRIAIANGLFYRRGNMSACRAAFWYRFDEYEGNNELLAWHHKHYPDRRRRARILGLQSARSD